MSKSTCSNCGQFAKDDDFDVVCTVSGREHTEAELSATESDAQSEAKRAKAAAAEEAAAAKAE